MIPSDPDKLKKAKELADRNIANGDWGDEVTISGFPAFSTPSKPEEVVRKGVASGILAKKGAVKLPRRKPK